MAKYEIAFNDKQEEVSVYLVRNGSCFTSPPEVVQLEPTPYIKPDMELLADEAHGIGFSEGYEQGIKQGRKEMCEAVIKLADVGTRICAFDGGSIEYIFRTYKPETILGELAHFNKQKFDKDLSTLVEQYGYDDAKHECTDCQKIMMDAEQERVDKAYQQGVNDAENRKATCEFCGYVNKGQLDEPCKFCANNYINMFRPRKDNKLIRKNIKDIMDSLDCTISDFEKAIEEIKNETD